MHEILRTFKSVLQNDRTPTGDEIERVSLSNSDRSRVWACRGDSGRPTPDIQNSRRLGSFPDSDFQGEFRPAVSEPGSYSFDAEVVSLPLGPEV
jgi:hypothetical protein